MPAGRRLRRRTSASVPVQRARRANPRNPRLRGFGICKRARPRAKQLARCRTSSRLLGEQPPRNAKQLSGARRASAAGEQARRRMRDLAICELLRRRRMRDSIGEAGSASGEPARHRGSSLRVGGASSPSDQPEPQNRRSSLTLGRAGSPLGEQARPSASSRRIGRAGSASALRRAPGRTSSPLRTRARREMNGLKIGCIDSGNQGALRHR
jgi:hypothetical protein